MQGEYITTTKYYLFYKKIFKKSKLIEQDWLKLQIETHREHNYLHFSQSIPLPKIVKFRFQL